MEGETWMLEVFFLKRKEDKAATTGASSHAAYIVH